VPPGGRWAQTAMMNSSPNPPWGDGVTFGADVTDATGALAEGANASPLVAPIVIANQDRGAHPSAIVFGDSISSGISDYQDGILDLGYVARALNGTRDGGQVPFANVSLGGEAANDVATPGYARLRKRLPDLVGFRDAIVAFGTNDLVGLHRSGNEIIGDLRAFATLLHAKGLRVWMATLVPRTTSTDGWTSALGQTPTDGYQRGAARDQVNAWIRSVPDPIAGVLEVADAVETSRGSGLWRVGATAWTLDGTHPTSHASGAMADAIPVSRFTSL
jgi:hypothetical protein